MDATNLKQIADWTGGSLSGVARGPVLRVVTDSRAVRDGDLFVALVGERFDAHDFLSEVAAQGAVAAVVKKGQGPRPDGMAIIEVDDTLLGLQRLAGSYRKTLPVRTVGVTGSNGKTSTKDFTFAVLRQKYSGWCTQGNLNNHIGVPLTLLSGGGSDQVAVVEMGMNHAGEIAPLAEMAAPEVGIITNIGVAHIEYLGSKEAIAVEKGALARQVSSVGTVVLNAEDEFTSMISEMTRANVLTAGIQSGDIQAVDLFIRDGGTRFALVYEGERAEVELSVPGKHMVRNAALAAAAGIAMGVSLAEAASGLSALNQMRGRLESKVVGGIRFVDDSYNANPDSMEAALTTLAQWPVSGRRIAILGRMGELGAFAESGHRKVGAAAAFHCVDRVFTIGQEAHWISDEAKKCGLQDVEHFQDIASAAAALRKDVSGDDLVLVKGSRSAGMERLIAEVERL